jgi:hypothetical protein
LARPKNRRRALAAALLALTLIPVLAVPAAQAGGGFEPQPPDYLIEIVPGIPLVFELKDEIPFEPFSVRFDIDGKEFVTDHFAPYGDYIPTRFIERRGISFETVHDFNIVADPLTGPEVTVAEYHLLVHEMPVLPPFQPLPLVRENRTELVGFQLRGVRKGSKVRAWARGFQETRRRQLIPLRPIRISENSRTYTVPGGLTWRRRAQPQVTFSVHSGEVKYGVGTLGRIFTGALRTGRDGDTRIRGMWNANRCTDEISRDLRPPPLHDCERLY